MSDVLTDASQSPGPEASQPVQADGVPDAARGLDLDGLLNEFDSTVASRAGQSGLGEKPAQPDAATAAGVEYRDGLEYPDPLKAFENSGAEAEKLLETAQASGELQKHLGTMTRAMAAMQAERVQQMNKSDFANIVKIANETVADFKHLPADFAERWLMSESLKDPQLREAFDRRYESQQALAWANSRMKRAMERLYKEASRAPDPNLTEDRAALTAFMMRGHGSAPESAPPKLGRMTDREFENFRKENYGF